jgi:LuxR family maltose regulon positive regulatory protein
MPLAKTTRPTVTGSLARPRLFRWLDRARKAPVTWVWAPPGAGKTILIASYIVARSVSNFWYQIDDGDNDLATFFYFLGLAAPKRRRPLPLFTPEYRQGISTFTRNFFRELYSRLKTPFVLVFDNYQEVPVDSELHDVMRDAVTELPQGGRAIFISRSDPPASFARLRADQAVEILGWPELRFTEAEMGSLVRKLAPGKRPKETLPQLYESADGWAAGLVLLLEHQGNGQASANQGKQSSEVLFDYFAGEIFKKFSPETKEVLLETAFLPRVTASMAEKLTGQPIAGQVLADLHRQNYFTNRRVAGELVYEYHPLFREFLLSQGQRVYSSERRAEIRRGAAKLAEAAGQIEAAVELFRDAEDWEGLARLTCSHAPALLSQGRVQTLEAWLRMLPPQIFDQVPWLLYWRGICRLGWRHEECRRDFEPALSLFRRQRDTAGIFLAWSAVVFSYIFESYSRPLDPWIALLDELVQEAQRFPSKEVEAQVATSMLAAVAFRQPAHPDGAYWAERALELTRHHPDLGLRTVMAYGWLCYHWQLGNNEKAFLLVDDMWSLMRAPDVPPYVVLMVGNVVAFHEWMSASPSCRGLVAEMLEFAEKTGVVHSANYSTLRFGIVAALDHGDLTTATTWLREMETALPRLGPHHRCWYHSSVVIEALIRGDVERATAHQPEMLKFGLDTGWQLDEACARLLSAQVRQARGDERAAREHLERALEIGRRMRSPFVEFMGRLTEAQLCFARGEDSAGLGALLLPWCLGRPAALSIRQYGFRRSWQSCVRRRSKWASKWSMCRASCASASSCPKRARLILKRGPGPLRCSRWGASKF